MSNKERQDHSFGIIPLRRSGDQWEVFMIQHENRWWSFPKGHPEGEETPMESAQRELTEETGLVVTEFLEETPWIENYQFTWKGTLIHKQVSYFVAEVEGQISLQLDEVSDGRWVPLATSQDHATYPQAKALCARLQKRL